MMMMMMIIIYIFFFFCLSKSSSVDHSKIGETEDLGRRRRIFLISRRLLYSNQRKTTERCLFPMMMTTRDVVFLRHALYYVFSLYGDL